MTRETGISQAESHFFRDEPGLVPLYPVLRKMILSVCPDCEIRVQKTQLSFRAPRPFAWVWLPPRKNVRGRPDNYLILSFASRTPIMDPLIVQCVKIRTGLYTCHAILSREKEICCETAGWLASSLDLRNPAESRRPPGAKT